MLIFAFFKQKKIYFLTICLKLLQKMWFFSLFLKKTQRVVSIFFVKNAKHFYTKYRCSEKFLKKRRVFFCVQKSGIFAIFDRFWPFFGRFLAGFWPFLALFGGQTSVFSIKNTKMRQKMKKTRFFRFFLKFFWIRRVKTFFLKKKDTLIP